MIKKKMLRVISLVVIFCLTLTFTVFAEPHNNMPSGQEKKLARYNFDYNTSANFMKEKGIIKGYGDGDFGFNDYVKRGDISVMIVRAFNINAIINKYVENFEDVEYGSYYYDAIATVKSHGIAKGDGKHFNPKKYVTIEEAIAFIERSAAVVNNNVVLPDDVDLHDIYDDKEVLLSYATRKDIANMLYYVLTGDEYDENDNDLKTVGFTIVENTVLSFDDDNLEKLMNEIDEDFDYLKFTLPLKTEGKLYYDYTSATNYDSLVKTTTEYYKDADPKISDIAFVPKTDYSGTVSIKYTAYDEDGDSYLGIIEIVVEDDFVSLDTIEYDIEENTSITFDEDDFIEVLKEETTAVLNHVKFILPSKYEGKLYYAYSSESNYKSIVTERDKYFVDSSKYINKITFVPNKNYEGMVSIEYIAYDVDGDSYNGVMEITIIED